MTAASGYPVVRLDAAVTGAQMREVDRIATEELGLDLARMMENAGRSLADLVMRTWDPPTAIVLAGPGGNGGGGLVAARHLANRGSDIKVVLARSDVALVTAQQLRILEAMDISITDGSAPARHSSVVIDALLGYGARGGPTGRVSELISWAAGGDAPIVALDVPSGVDATTGETFDPAVPATATLTLALPKTGLSASISVGRLYVADISIPATVFARVGVEVPPDLFRPGPIIEVDQSGPGGSDGGLPGPIANRLVHDMMSPTTRGLCD